MERAPDVLRTLADRFDPAAFDSPRGRALLRLRVEGEGDWDALADGHLELRPAGAEKPDARLSADAATWRRMGEDVRGGMEAFRRGRLTLRDDLHLGVGFLAATSGLTGPERLEVGRVGTRIGDIAVLRDACEIERAHVVGNSMGGRVALEVGFDHPDRVGRLALLAPSLAWLRERPWAPLLKALRPELGLLQPAPRPIVEGIVRSLVPGARYGWSAVGVDEFLRAYLSPRGRAAFYAAARNIYLEEPDRFWSRLKELQGDALFIWGKQDRLVPIGFA